MKKAISKIIAVVMMILIATLLPAQVYAGTPEYICDVKIGFGSDMDEAEEALDGYEIVTKDGEPADINAESGSFGGGKGDRVVLLGYKTTTVKSDAITDLGILNMNGEVSYADMGLFIQEKMDTLITPLIDNFVTSLKEYRINYNSNNQKNKERAKIAHDILNSMYDEDTGMSIGDLLLNETKYEMGDDAYNKLSQAEKSKHADLVTILLQSCDVALQTMEKALAMACDTGEDNWLERFPKKTYKDMIYDTGLPPKDAKKQLSLEYYDDAQLIISLWDDFNKSLEQYEEHKKLLDTLAENVDYKKAFETIENTDLDNASNEELKAYAEANTVISQHASVINDLSSIIAIRDYLETIPYGKTTMLDFFLQPVEDIEKTQTSLYPLIASLTDGQRAALNFMSLEDLVMMTLQNKETYTQSEMSEQEPISVYFGIDRDAFDIGGVAVRPNTSIDSISETLSVDPKAYLVWKNYKVGTDAVVGNAFMDAFKYMKDDFVMPKVNFVMPLYKVYQVYSNISNNGKLLFVTDVIAPDRTKYLMDCFEKYSTGFWDFQVGYSWEGAKVISETSAYEMQHIKDNISDWMKANGSNTLGYIAYGITFASASFNLYSLTHQYDIDYTPAPSYVYDTITFNKYNDKGEKMAVDSKAVRYKACICNRENGDEYYSSIGNKADLNGDQGRQWLVLYATKDQSMDPILADSFVVQYGDSNLPAGYKTGLHLFGSTGAVDLNSKDYCWANGMGGIWVFFKRDPNAASTATNFTGGTLAIFTGSGVVVGAVGTAVAMTVSRKRKAEEVNE